MAALHFVVRGVEGWTFKPREHPVVAFGMVARAVVDGPEDRQPIHPPRLLGQELSQIDAGETGGDRAKWPAKLARGIRLGIPGLHVPGTAAQPEQDDAFFDLFPTDSGRRSNSQQVGQGQSADAQDARLNKAAPRDPVAIPRATPRDFEHDDLISLQEVGLARQRPHQCCQAGKPDLLNATRPSRAQSHVLRYTSPLRRV